MKAKIIGILLVCVLFFGCKDNELKVSTAANFAPFEYIDGGEFKGIDMEIVKIIADELKMKLAIKDMEFDSVVSSVASKNSDIAISGLTINETRKQVIDFSDTYFNAAQVILVRENDKRFAGFDKLDSTHLIKQVNNLDNLKIGVQAGTTGEFYAKGDKDWGFVGFKNAQTLSFANGAMAVMAMLNSQIDMVIIDAMPANVLAKSNDGVKLIPASLTNESYAIGVSKDNKELLKEINRILGEIKKDGRLDNIIAKYYQS